VQDLKHEAQMTALASPARLNFILPIGSLAQLVEWKPGIG
jgi:hypothetical protein